MQCFLVYNATSIVVPAFFGDKTKVLYTKLMIFFPILGKSERDPNIPCINFLPSKNNLVLNSSSINPSQNHVNGSF